MKLVEIIIQAIKDATNISPVVKGGNRPAQIEYLYSRDGLYTYRLEIDVNGDNLLKVQEITEKILLYINDFGDLNWVIGSSVDITGGGILTHDNIITQVLYFNCVDYNNKYTPVKPPSGKLKVTVNGIYDISQYAEVEVAVSGGSGEPYEGPLEYWPKLVDQLAPTAGKTCDEDIIYHAIESHEAPNPYGNGLVLGRI